MIRCPRGARETGFLLAVLLVPPSLAAQSNLHVTAGGAGIATKVFSEEPLVDRRLSGFLVGGEVGVELGRFSVSTRYAEGTVEASNQDFTQDLVEGEFMLGARPVSWVTVKLGPHVRSFAFADGTRRRWLLWEGRLRAEARLLDQVVLSYIEGWRSFAAAVSGSNPLAWARGAEGGIIFRFENLPVWTRFGYRVQRSRLEGLRKPQTLEQITVAVGLKRD